MILRTSEHKYLNSGFLLAENSMIDCLALFSSYVQEDSLTPIIFFQECYLKSMHEK